VPDPLTVASFKVGTPGCQLKGYEMESRSIKFSRRHVLARSAVLAAGVVMTLIAQQPATAKASKSEFLYQDHPHDGRRCADCKHFAALGSAGTGTCDVVEGAVSANGWCEAFAAGPRVSAPSASIHRPGVLDC